MAANDAKQSQEPGNAVSAPCATLASRTAVQWQPEETGLAFGLAVGRQLQLSPFKQLSSSHNDIHYR
jgi:hypothetical protein